MKTSKYLLLVALAALGLYNCEKFEELGDVASIGIITLPPDISTKTIQGEIRNGIGDGLVENGFVYSSNTSVEPEIGGINDGIIQESPLDQPGIFGTTGNLTTHFSPGVEYVIRAYAEDVHNCIQYGDMVILRLPNPGMEPVADFSIQYNNGAEQFCYTECTVSFTNTSSNFDSFSWDFGDGNIETSNENPTHTYKTPGPFTVRLTVAKSGFSPNTKSVQVDIRSIKFSRPYTDVSEGIKILPYDDGYLILGIKRDEIQSTSDAVILITDRFGNPVGSPIIMDFSDKDVPGGMTLIGNSSRLIVAGTTNRGPNHFSDIFISRIELEQTPPLQNTQFYGSEDLREEGFDIIEQPIGSRVLVTGRSFDPDLGLSSANVYFINTDNNLSSSSFNNAINLPDSQEGKGLILSDNTGVVNIIGNMEFPEGSGNGQNIMFMKIHEQGTLISGFPKVLKPNANGFSISETLTPMRYLISTKDRTNESIGDILTLEVDESGNIINSIDAFLSQSGIDECLDSEMNQDGNIFICGRKNNLPFISKLDGTNWEPVWIHNTLSSSPGSKLNALIPTPDGGVIATGSFGGILFLVKADLTGSTTP